MRLSRIPSIEATVKHSLTIKESTSEMLHQYKEACEEIAEVEVHLRDLVEQMLVDFMDSDRTFQRYLKDKEAKAKKAAKAAEEEKKAKEKDKKEEAKDEDKAGNTAKEISTPTTSPSSTPAASPSVMSSPRDSNPATPNQGYPRY